MKLARVPVALLDGRGLDGSGRRVRADSPENDYRANVPILLGYGVCVGAAETYREGDVIFADLEIVEPPPAARLAGLFPSIRGAASPLGPDDMVVREIVAIGLHEANYDRRIPPLRIGFLQ